MIYHLRLRGYVFPLLNDESIAQADLAKKAKGSLEQPRGRLPPLISEFGATIEKYLPSGSPNDQIQWQENGATVHGKILRVLDQSDASGDFSGQIKGRILCIVGVYRSPAAFFEEAKAVTHPFDQEPLCADLREAVSFVTTQPPDSVTEFRSQKIADIRERAAHHRSDEAILHNAMPSYRRLVLHNKNLLLLEELRAEIGHEDEDIVLDMARGFPLTGVPKRSGIFPHKLRPREFNEDQLRRSSVWLNKSIAGKMRPSLDNEQDTAVTAETADELKRHWLEGPLSTSSLDDLFPLGWVASRRFAIRQGGKWRVIDDYSESWVNSCYELNERISPHTVEDTINIIMQLLKALGGKATILGRTADLKSAYRQLAVADSSAWCSVLAVFVPMDNERGGRVDYYLQRALPFGAVASVVAFNRFSRLLWRIATVSLKLCISNYFDDYPMVDVPATAMSSWLSFEALLLACGVLFATADKKRKPPADQFGMLGVLMDLRGAPEGLVLVKNTPARKEEITATIASILEKSSMSPSLASSLSGILQYAERQIYGCTAGQVVRVIRAHGLSSSGLTNLSDVIVTALQWIGSRLLEAPDRRFLAVDPRKPLLVFTDGAVEGDVATFGAMMWDPEDSACEQFGDHIPDEVARAWRDEGSKQIIHQTELWPAAIARHQWASRMINRRVLFFIDNDAARVAIIKGSSSNVHSDRLVWIFHGFDVELQCRLWVARVPSHSNPGDHPSRLDFVTNERAFACVTIQAQRMHVEAGELPWIARLKTQRS